ncbi:hypothetical protein SARC_13631, partial [Sphaeroforma arctica JP610]
MSASPSPSTSSIVPAVISGTVTGVENGEGIAGVPVTATCSTDESTVYTTTTIADGSYSFNEAVDDCSYTITVPETYNGEVVEGPNTQVVVITPTDRTGVATFEFIPLGTISGRTLNDFDGAPLAGEFVLLSCGNITSEAITNATGHYVFEDLVDCEYIITAPFAIDSDDFTGVIVEGPVDADSTEEDTTVTIDRENLSKENVDFKYLPQGSISGSLRDEVTKVGIATETVTLTCDEHSPVKVITTTTDVDGNYEFTGLGYCNYKVEAPATVASVGDVFSGPDDTDEIESSTFVEISVLDQSEGEVDFTYSQVGSVSGTIYEDLEAVENGVDSVVVTLTCTENADVFYEETTDASGVFNFNSVPLCKYTIVVPEEVNTTVGLKPISEGYDVDDTKTVADVNVDSETTDVTGVDYIYKVPTPAVISGVVTGLEDGEGIEGVTVTVTCSSDTEIKYEAITDANGTYTIADNVVDCLYTVEVPETFNGEPIEGPSSDEVNITPNDRTGQVDFTYLPLGAISGHTLNDFDQSLLAGVSVMLACNDDVVKTTTDSTGFYIFEELVDCNYTVTVPLSVQTTDFDGIIVVGPIDSDKLVEKHSIIIDIEHLTEENVDFKYLPQGTIAGTLQDHASTAGIADQTVTLTCADPETTMTTQSDANGNYMFSGLGYCDYTVAAPASVDTFGNIYEGPYDDEDVLWSTSVAITFEDPSEGEVNFSYASVGSISGTIYEDSIDLSNGVSAVPVTLVCTDSNNFTMTTATEANGAYAFNDIPLCVYTISVPEEVSTTGGSKPIAEGYDDDDTKAEAEITIDLTKTDVTDVDFLYKVPAVISGLVTGFEDGEGIENVTVTLTCLEDMTIVYEAITNETGAYTIDENIEDCTYTIAVPESYNGEPIQGPANKTVAITPTGRTGTADFEYVPLGSIFGFTRNDFDQSPLADVIVTLSCDGVEVNSTTTDKLGHYVFEDLEDCAYTVTAPLSVSQSDFAGIITDGPVDEDGSVREHKVKIDIGNMHEENVDFAYLPQGSIS